MCLRSPHRHVPDDCARQAREHLNGKNLSPHRGGHEFEPCCAPFEQEAPMQLHSAKMLLRRVPRAAAPEAATPRQFAWPSSLKAFHVSMSKLLSTVGWVGRGASASSLEMPEVQATLCFFVVQRHKSALKACWLRRFASASATKHRAPLAELAVPSARGTLKR